MLAELTLFTTLAIHHLVIGMSLLVTVWLAFKLCKLNSEVQSWTWLTVFFISTLIPVLLIVPENNKSPTFVQLHEQSTSIATVANSEIKGTLKHSTTKDTNSQWNISSQWVQKITLLLYLFLIIWLLGSCWRAFNVIKALWRTKQLLSTAESVTNQEDFSQLGHFVLLTSNYINSPLVIGVIKPTIILPKQLFAQFHTQQLNPIILHEMAHVERKDPWIGVLQESIAIVFWWSPIMRIINRQIHINRELACDMRAANKLDNSKQYAQSLIDCAKLMLSQKSNVLAMGLFSHKKDLTHRINEVLKMKHVKHSNLLGTLALCLSLSITTISLARENMPKINLSNIKVEANHFSQLSEGDSEQLQDAIEKNNLNFVQSMIDNGLDINKPIKGEGTALIMAVDDNNLFMVKNLIQLGADVNQSAEGDGSPLIVAAVESDVSIAKLLLQHGANVNAIVIHDETALISASREGNFSMVKFLVENGADVNLGVNVDANLYMNGENEWNNNKEISEDIQRELNLSGNDFDNKTSQKILFRTPLNMAASSNIKDYLLSQGATK